MKKLIIAAAIVCAAAMSQAAIVKWVTAANLQGVDVAAVTGNGTFGAAGDAKSNTALTFSLTIYEAGTKTVADSVTDAAIKYATGKKTVAYSKDFTKLAQGTAYDYELVITGTQTDLSAKTSPELDFSAAQIATTLTGSFTTEPTGTTQFSADPTTWTVSGVQSVPEPTSGLLLLLGVAGLALRRRRA